MKVYLTAASFEERCTALPDGIEASDNQEIVVLLDFQGYDDIAPYLFNRAHMSRVFSHKGYQIKAIDAEVACPLAAADRVEAAITASGASEVVFDISAIPRNHLFVLCRRLADLNVPTKITYYRPEKYGSELSRGVRSIQPISGFEGDIDSGTELVLAVILGFEGYKAIQAWESIGPNRVIALFGDPPYTPEFLERSRLYNEEFLAQVGESAKFSLHTHDVLTAKGQLQKIYDQTVDASRGVSFVICPLGTKLQALAAFAFAYSNESVAVVTVSSLKYYTEDYSRGYDPESTSITLSELLSH